MCHRVVRRSSGPVASLCKSFPTKTASPFLNVTQFFARSHEATMSIPMSERPAAMVTTSEIELAPAPTSSG